MPVINSRAITFADYNAETRELSITFKQGHTYTYYDVPPNVYANLISASSAGTYFNTYIRDAYGIR